MTDKLFGIKPSNYSIWSKTVMNAKGIALSPDIIERARNNAIFGFWGTDREMLIDELKQNKIGRILYD